MTSTPSRFEKKAREIINWNIHEAREDLTALSSAISSALEAAYQEGRKDENALASSAVVAEAYWRHQGVTPDENTQTAEEIYAQNVAFERRCLFFMCEDYSEPKPLLTERQINEIRRRYQAIKEPTNV